MSYLCYGQDEERKTASMAKRRTASLVWTDDEVQLLLKVTLDYKASVAADRPGFDWESSHSKYWDILQRFLDNYPSAEAASAMGKDFPHKKKDITKAQLTSKLKNMRTKYRQSAEAGQKNPRGRVVLLFYKMCETIWGSSPVIHPIYGGMETSDVSPETPTASEESLNEEIDNRRQQLDTSLANHRRNKLKRLRPSDVVQEDLEIKRQLLRQLETTDSQFINTIGRLSSSVDRMNSNIELLVQHLVGTSRHNYVPPPSPQPQPIGSTRGLEEFSPLTGLFKVELS
ncbi:uncharacterized protein LOC121680823 [Alosa sapidissima]|uniref:uncharacterized protein LOC121680823 n=1 Tax=Alosa sapidissima TaxID=34773 RepID=UPI001C085C94|nr:uncharacterized protein LOC121680823 [Alosa sapidissima]